MKRMITFLSALAIFFVPLTLSVHAQEAEGELDDPNARAHYDWLRLHDPTTGLIPDNIREKELQFAKTLPTKEALAKAFIGKSGNAAQAQTAVWSPRGPYNIGGRTRGFAMDIVDSNVFIAGGVSGGMWRSSDGGASWSRATAPNQLHSVTRVAQDTRSGKTNIWYQGTGELDGQSQAGGAASFRGDGIFKSTDDGISWAQLPSTVSGTPQLFDPNAFKYIWNVVIDPSNLSQDVVYAAIVDRIARSTDGGTTWTTVLGASSLGTGYSRYTDVAISPTGVLYATLSGYNNLTGNYDSPDQGIYRSTDGVNWTNITPVGWPASYNRVVIAISPSNENVVYFLGDTPGSGFHTVYAGGNDDNSLWKYTYVSGDGSGAGGTWVNRSANMPAFGGNVGDYASQGGYDLVVAVRPDNENTVYLGGTNLYRSTDGFATTSNTTWIGGYSTVNDVSQYANHHPDQHVIFFHPTNFSSMLSGNDGGVYKTTDDLASTVAWNSLNHGYNNAQFYTIALDHGTPGNNVVIGGMQDNGTWFTNTTNSGTPWVNITGGDGAYCAIADGRSSYYASFPQGDIYRLLLNNSGLGTGFTRVTPTGASGFLFVNPFLLDPNNTDMMYLAGGNVVWRNTNLTGIPLSSNSTTSVNWTQLTNTSVGSSTISALGISTTTANRLFYGTADGKIYRIDGANTGNPSPTDVWTGKGFPSGAYVECITVDPTNYNKAIVAFSNYSIKSLFYTTNGGTNWSDVSGNLEQNPDGSGNGPSTRWVKIMPSGVSSIYFVGTSTGLYSTTNLNGTSTVWGQEGSSTIGNVVVDMIDARQSDGFVAVGTHANSIFSTNIVTSFTVKIRKYRDTDGDPSTTGDQTPRKWHLALYLNNLSNLVAQADTSELTVNNLSAGTYIAAEADSGSQWIRINGNGTRYDTLSVGTTATVIDTFANLMQNTLTVRKFQDYDGNFSTTSGRVLKSWHLEIHKNSAGGPLIASGDSTIVSASGLGDGTYYAVEADSVDWNHLGYVTDGFSATASSNNFAPITLVGGGGGTIDFVNSNINQIYNSLTVRKFADEDRNISTTGDRVAKKWHLEIHQGTVNGPLVVSGDSSVLTANMLTDWMYYAVEADSNDWIHLGYSVDGGAPVSSTNNYYSITLSGGQNSTVDFLNAPPIYSQSFRTATMQDWAYAADKKGKFKSAKRKADKVYFRRNIGAPTSTTGFTMKTNMYSTGKVYSSKAKIDTLIPTTPWDSVKEVTYNVALNSGDSLQVEGRGLSGKLFDFSVVWATSPRPITVHYKKDTPGWKLNKLGLPMPNLNNVGEELFPKGFGQNTTYYNIFNPLYIGQQKGGTNPNSVKHLKFTDVLKTLIKRVKTGDVLHTHAPRCLNYFDTDGSLDPSKPISKQVLSLPPDKHNNKLLAEILALKLNVAASVTGKFPGGLGGLTYSDSSYPGNPLNGQTVDSIIIKADHLLACYSSAPLTPQEVYDAVRAIDSVFSGSVDTNGFAAKTALTGTKMLSEVGILHATPGVVPKIFFSPDVVNDNTPLVYALRQNFPNPFNPVTTIQFELPEPAVVTLKVYSILGQEVATLIDNETMEDGFQQMDFDASNVASGVYFYRIEAHGLSDDEHAGQIFRSVKKMMVLK